MTEVRHLRALQAFDAAATHSSLSKAAEGLGVTHGAVSRQIKQLELYLGVPLLHRRPNGVEKTDAISQGATFGSISHHWRDDRRYRKLAAIFPHNHPG